jgi:hypothetical protein
MFEKETERAMHLIRRSTIGDAEAVGLREIFESGIPHNVKTFFKGETERLLVDERAKIPQSLKFPYHLPDVQMLQEQIDLLLIHNFVFSRQDFESTLDTCIHFLFNYLCRPQWTLTSFLFEAGNPASASAVDRRLNYCRDYGYFITILRRYLQEKQIDVLSQEQAGEVLRKIDREITKDPSPQQLAEMTRPVYDFVAYARTEEDGIPEKSVPTRALMYFFDDKGMSAISDRLARARDEEDLKEIRFSRLVALIAEVGPVVLTTESGEAAFSNFEETAPETGESSTDYSRQAVNNLPKPLSPLFSIEEERAIVKFIFNKDEGKFHATVEEILSSSTWGDAALAIDHYFTMNDVEPFSKEAILFTNLLQNRFNDKPNSR